MLAKPPEIPAKMAVWLASSASDGRGGKLVSVSSPVRMLGSALQEGLRAVFQRPAAEPDVRVRSLPPAD